MTTVPQADPEQPQDADESDVAGPDSSTCRRCGAQAVLGNGVLQPHSVFMGPPYGPPVDVCPDGFYCGSCLNGIENESYAEHPEYYPTRCSRCEAELGRGKPGLKSLGWPIGTRVCTDCQDDLIDLQTGGAGLYGGRAEIERARHERPARERAYEQRRRLNQLEIQQQVLIVRLREVPGDPLAEEMAAPTAPPKVRRGRPQKVHYEDGSPLGTAHTRRCTGCRSGSHARAGLRPLGLPVSRGVPQVARLA